MSLDEQRRGRVTRATRREMEVETDTGKITVPNESMGAKGLDHAYSMTAHAYQGQTVPKILIGMSAGERLANQKQFYVSISRVSEGATLITDDAEKLAEKIQNNSGARTPALTAYNDARNRELQELQKAAEQDAEKRRLNGPKEDQTKTPEKHPNDAKDKTKDHDAAYQKAHDEAFAKMTREIEKEMQRGRSGPTR